jgi:hypothetical protein
MMRSIILTGLILLAGCTPVYQVMSNYTPPGSEAGQHCLRLTCQNERQICNSQCYENYIQCQKIQKQQALDYFEQSHDRLLKAYRYDYDEYLLDLSQYSHDKERLRNKLREAQKICDNGINVAQQKGCLQYEQSTEKMALLKKTSEPFEPKTREEVIKQYQANCAKSCPVCTENYNLCYVGCGGQLEQTRVCIRNCQ